MKPHQPLTPSLYSIKHDTASAGLPLPSRKGEMEGKGLGVQDRARAAGRTAKCATLQRADQALGAAVHMHLEGFGGPLSQGQDYSMPGQVDIWVRALGL